MSCLQKLTYLLSLDFQIVLRGTRSDTNPLHLLILLRLPFLTLLLLFLITELIKILNLSNRGFCLGRYFYKVKAIFLSERDCFIKRLNAKILSVLVNDANLFCFYIVVDAVINNLVYFLYVKQDYTSVVSL